MRQQWYRLLIVPLLALLVVTGQALAANGKITGVVKSTAGEAAVGANVVVEGTTLGGTTDANGLYYVLNVPPGTYRVRASAVGFTPQVVTDVRVAADQIVTVNFTLQEQAVGMNEVVVQAERPVVDKSQTASKSTLQSDEILSLPVASSVGLIATSPSAFNGFIRGGKINETKTIVDGVDVSDNYYAQAGLTAGSPANVFQTYTSTPTPNASNLSQQVDVNFSSIEQMTVNTGAVGAEYSSATAGVINYSLREGRGPLSGMFNGRISQFKGLRYNGPDVYWNDPIYFKEKSDLSLKVDQERATRASGGATPTLAADSARLGRYTYYKGKYIHNKPQMELEGSLGGGVTEDWGVYFTGKYMNSYERLPNQHVRTLDMTLKSTYNFTGDMKLTALGIMNDRGLFFGWKNTDYQESSRFFLEGVPKNDGGTIIGSLKWTHALTPGMFYEIQASVNYENDRQGYSDDNHDGIPTLGENGDYITLSTLAEANKYISNSDLSKYFRNQDEPASSTNYNFNAGNTTVRLSRPGFFYENLKQRIWTVKGDFTDQITANHLLRAGAQARLHNYDMVRRSSYLGAIDTRKQFYNEVWDLKPKELGFYASDRMEYAGMIINLGVRVDSWDPNANDFTNYFAPFRIQGISFDTTAGKEPVTLIQDRVAQRGRKVDPYWFFSPRIGVSHPISENAALYFSYSRMQIPPPVSRLFAFYNNFGNTSLPNVPSIRQDPSRSSNYEIGIQWQFAENYGLNLTAYLRDIENYGTYSFFVNPRSGPTGVPYYILTSAGYGDARGVELTLRARPQRIFDFFNITGQLAYTYSYIKASNFAGLDKTMLTTFTTSGDSARLGGDLPFSDLKFYNTVETNVSGANSTLTGGYDRTHRITYQFVATFPYDIRLSSTGTFQSGFYFPETQLSDPRVIGRELGQGPWNKMVNVRLEKGFALSGNLRVALYADVQNFFNWVNILAYDNTTTGQVSWEKSVAAGEPNPTGSQVRPVGPDNSFFYDIPREYYFGVRLDF